MSDLEALLRLAIENKVTVIHLDTAQSVARASCWCAFKKFHIAYDKDPITALRLSIEKALAPPPPSHHDLSTLLS